jgi:MoaA/NifB/PqqE/SkfB family radical SAM enzyme
MIARIGWRLLRETDVRLLWKFAHNVGWKGMRTIGRFKKRAAAGEFFPAFVFVSVTNDCNLTCKGCWVSRTVPPRQLSAEALEGILSQSQLQGCSFFGILGGEPLMYPDLLRVLSRHPDCYFQIFTNGTLLSDGMAAEMRRMGNVTPLISIEGLAEASDERRGGRDVYPRALEALAVCRRHRLITGVATSVCQSNFEDLVSEPFVEDLVKRGVHYVWYYVYRPVGRDPAPELALTADQIVALRRFIVGIRTRAPLIVVDAYWDHEGNALCPAAVGISHHVGPEGDIEPCPPVQFARERYAAGADLAGLVVGSEFLRRFRQSASGGTRGCILLESPAVLLDLVRQTGAYDTSGRGTGEADLASMEVRPSHHLPGREIPERNWFYRFAKRNWFFGFGAYG